MTLSADLHAGTRIRHVPTGDTAVLVRRKDPTEQSVSRGLAFHDGWWIEWDHADHGAGPGIADRALDDPDGDYEIVGDEG